MIAKGKRTRSMLIVAVKIAGGMLCLLLLTIAVIALIPQGTKPIKGANSIASLESVKIGGLEQWILVRGHDKNAPVVLFVHGGPGSAQISLSPKFLASLEEHFVVVNWDQRGSGKSWSKGIDPATMTVEQIVADTLELTNYLRDRFNQDKIYLVGHSWGSYIGVLAAQQSPELYHAYISVSQMVSYWDGEELSYQLTLEEAQNRGNAKALKELEVLGGPPYPNGAEDVIIQRKWLVQFGGIERQVNTQWEWLKALITKREYTLYDGYRYLQGANFSAEHLFASMAEIDLEKQVPTLELPVWFVAGKYDGITFPSLIQRYYQGLEAPVKEFVLFEDSAHLPYFEEPEKFTQLMLRILAETR